MADHLLGKLIYESDMPVLYLLCLEFALPSG